LLSAFNCVHAGMTAGNILFLLWAIVNYFVQQFRGIPFQWIDLGSVRTAMSVSGNYRYVMTWQIVAGITVSCVAVGLWWDLRPGKLMPGMRGRIASGLISLALIMAFWGVIFHTDFLKSTGIWLRDWQPWYTYRLFGMESGFLAFAKASFPEAPEGYSADAVKSIIDDSVKAAADLRVPGGDVPENVIVIMNESFSDLTIYPGFRASEDVIGGVRSLTENTQKGRLLVSVKGGTTANTEYEFLTGNSCVLSPTTVVYNSFIKQDQFSLARVLSAQGYKSIAMHPYGPYGWNRNVVYPRMGFEEFYSIKNAYGDAEKVRSFVGDRSDYDEIRKQLENKEDGERLFIFNITMQNHSQYRTEGFPSTVEVEGFAGKNKGQAEQYCTLLKISDEAIMEFLEYLKTLDQKTMVLFFGDHQPEIGDDFWEYCQGGDSDSWTFEEQQRAFETCFFLWANYDIPEAEGLMISANYLSAYLLSQTGLSRSGYEDHLLMMRGSIPAMNSFGYIDPDGTHHEWGEKDANPEAEEKLRQYKCLIYNELTGGDARDDAFFGVK
ncbi:MAG: LTA synthase family protein, partial [Lachnospiraceae bacterium]|nr:LTA synthase family protein [Lachnospiraceae bacterium]